MKRLLWFFVFFVMLATAGHVFFDNLHSVSLGVLLGSVFTAGVISAVIKP